MRAHEFLFEGTDPRSKVEKLQALIDHPSTNAHVRITAQERLSRLQASQTPVALSRYRLTTRTNLTEDDLDMPFIVGVKVGDVYESLCNLNPAPNEIQFLRQGQIIMIVPPPFNGLSKEQYYETICKTCPGVRRISAHHLGDEGYRFTLSYF